MTNENTVIELDLDALDALPQVSFATETLWTDGVIEFSGPSLMSVLELAGISGEPVVASALNDYAATIPAYLIETDFPIIATRMNNDVFGRRQKGPLWIVFPYDLSRRFQSELIFSSSVWQLIGLRPSRV